MSATGFPVFARFLAVLASLACLGLLSACAGPTYPNCTQDDHCKARGEFCVDQKCAQCRVTAQCPGSGDACVACIAGACGRKPDCCTSKLDCGTGKKCAANRCVAECVADSDCSPGSKCSTTGACVATVVAGGVSSGCTQDSDCGDGLHCKEGLCVDGSGECKVVPVRFEFNDPSLSATAQNILTADYKCMKLHKTRALTIEGHCDERGTDAYNMELGNRRAKAVKSYLQHLDGKFSLKTISYGKARPLCGGSDDRCYSENRRAEMTTVTH